jgi:sulfate transport system substrate-binding protein
MNQGLNPKLPKLYWIQAAVSFGNLVRQRAEELAQKRSASLLSLRLGKGSLSLSLFLLGLSLTLIAAACAPENINAPTLAQKADVELNLVSFSVTQAAHERIIPKFVEQWKQAHNQTISFKQSYGASGTQALLVVEGREEADVIHLSLAPDVHKIEEAGLIDPGWEKEFPNDSIVSKSVVAIVTREGNPKSIKTWSDLAKAGVSVITPNPYTSGGGRWNFLALWNAAIHAGEDQVKAAEFVTQVYKNSPALPGSARQATSEFFKGGQGDALITYENEVILKALKGDKLPYLVPEVNFSIDNPAAIVDQNVDKHGTREVAEAFVQYLYSPEAQAEFAKSGYRPIDPTVEQVKPFAQNYPAITALATVKDYGGWDKVQQRFFDTGALVSKIFRSINS